MMRAILSFLCLLLALPAVAATDAPSPAAKYKSNEPIEITADALEVFQAENRAVFTGHVVAVQGKTKLKSEKMVVHYRPSGEKSIAQQDAIKKIEVMGSVFLSTPEETASGATGLYDVENHKIHLNDNVVLTRGKNVLKGDKLTYDFETGKSVVTGGANVQTGGGKERVRALFIPDEKKKE